MHHSMNVQTGERTLTPLTSQEQADKDTARALYLANKPLADWKENMESTDSGMPRYLEDLITDKFAGNAGKNLQARYDAKIQLRGQRP